jgi:hypothetical protein
MIRWTANVPHGISHRKIMVLRGCMTVLAAAGKQEVVKPLMNADER